MRELLCRWLNQEQGSASILAVIVMTLLLVLGGAFILLSSTEADISRDYRNGVAAQYLAEAGVQWAIVKLKTEPSFVNSTGNNTGITTTSAVQNEGTTTAGTYTVKVAGTGTTRTITSTGAVGNGLTAAKRQVILNVTPAGVYGYPVYSATEVTVNGGGKVYLGGVGSQGTVSNAGYIEGMPNPYQSYVFPTFKESDYSSSTTLPGNINDKESRTNLSGTYYVDSDFNVSGELSAAGNSPVTIFVKGKVQINGNGRISGNFKIIATGDVDVNGYVNKAIFIAGGTAESHVNGGGTMYGSMIAKGKIIINGTVSYSEDLMEVFGHSFAVNSYSNY